MAENNTKVKGDPVYGSLGELIAREVKIFCHLYPGTDEAALAVSLSHVVTEAYNMAIGDLAESTRRAMFPDAQA